MVDLPAEAVRGAGLAAAGTLAVGTLALAVGRGAVGVKAGLFAAGWLFLGWGLLHAKPRPPNSADDRQASPGTDPGAGSGAAVRWLLAGGALLGASLLLELAGVGV